MNLRKRELQYRVEAYQNRLEAALAVAKAETAKGSRELMEEIENKLAALTEDLKGGWDHLSTGALKSESMSG